MLSRLMRVLLAVTSLAPIALVYAATLLTNQPVAAGFWAGGALLLSALCACLLALGRNAEAEPLDVHSIKSADREVLAFLVAYALPLVAGGIESVGMAPLIVFVGLLLVVVWNAQLIHVNPLLALVGYHFFEITTPGGATYLLVTRASVVRSGQSVEARRISSHVWLEA